MSFALSNPTRRLGDAPDGLSAPPGHSDSSAPSATLLGASDGFSGRPAFVLVTGSREFASGKTVSEALDRVLVEARALGFNGLVVVHGEAPGADFFAGRWANGHAADGVSVHRFPADWDGPCTGGCKHGRRPQRADGSTYCPAEGARRNQRMVDHVLAQAPERGRIGLAFLAEGASNRGTRDCLRRMRGRGMPVREFTGPARRR